jgi:hypothetical protein
MHGRSFARGVAVRSLGIRRHHGNLWSWCLVLQLLNMMCTCSEGTASGGFASLLFAPKGILTRWEPQTDVGDVPRNGLKGSVGARKSLDLI